MPDAGPAVSLLGQELDLEVGPVAHGGHCVARVGDQPGGRVVFVRHALPGERVRARITEDGGGSFVRADAVAVLRAAPDRVRPPCPHSGAGRCGGCDWQHVAPSAQRELKARVVREQFARLADLDVEVDVAELPGGSLHWRTRIGYAVDPQGRPGLRRHRSHQIETIDACALGVPGVGDASVLAQTWPDEARVEVVRDDLGQLCVLAQARPASADRRTREGRRRTRDLASPSRIIDGSDRLEHSVLGVNDQLIRFEVAASDFWQVHPAAAQTFATAVVAALAPRPGEVVLDLYCGAGLFTSVFAHAVGPAGRVVGIEGDERSVADAVANLRDVPWAEARVGKVSSSLIDSLELSPDLVVLDPPRLGLGASAMAAVLTLGARAVAYVSCDPASLARDVRVALDQGWRLGTLSAYDAFPMTHHIECIAILTPN